MARTIFDTYTFEGAEKLRLAIKDYWRKRGKFPNVWLRRMLVRSSETDAPRALYVIESNMVGGQPQ